MWRGTRRDLAAAAAAAGVAAAGGAHEQPQEKPMDDAFAIAAEELRLAALLPAPDRALSFSRHQGDPEAWRRKCRGKLAEVLGFARPARASVARVRQARHEGVTVEALVMDAGGGARLPAYLLHRAEGAARSAVMAIHGHGRVEPAIGLGGDDYHHAFALRLAEAGHTVLCPELRGFGALNDMAAADEGRWLDYWGGRRGGQFTLVTDAFLYGRTLVGQTVEDLLRWEDWLARDRGVQAVLAAGISYGGDLAVTYPAFSRRVRGIYCSGSMGSFTGVFARCYNAPAHCIPGVLKWMDRSDIAGLSAPVPLRLHYGEADTPGPDNASAAYNETVQPALDEVRAIYRAFKAETRVSMRVTPRAGHEFEVEDLLQWAADGGKGQ